VDIRDPVGCGRSHVLFGRYFAWYDWPLFVVIQRIFSVIIISAEIFVHYIARLENLVWRQTVQRSLLFQYPVNRRPYVSFHAVAVNIAFCCNLLIVISYYSFVSWNWRLQWSLYSFYVAVIQLLLRRVDDYWNIINIIYFRIMFLSVGCKVYYKIFEILE